MASNQAAPARRMADILYANCGRFTDDSYGLTLRLLEETGVAFTPGIDFGHHLPQRHVRFAYTNAIPQLAEGMERLQRALWG